MTRGDVYSIIDKERDYQDTNYDPEFVLPSGLTRRQRDKEVSVGITMLEAYCRKAGDAWVSSKGTNLPALRQVAKIAAIAVRVLERAGDSEELLTNGLR